MTVPLKPLMTSLTTGFAVAKYVSCCEDRGGSTASNWKLRGS